MKTVVVSDIHLGSRFCFRDMFLEFLERLPPDASLVMNGDTIDVLHRPLPPEDEQVLGRSHRERTGAAHRGDGDPAQIDFRSSYSIEKKLFVSHGYDFDNVMPYHRTFVRLFRTLHRLRILLGA